MNLNSALSHLRALILVPSHNFSVVLFFLSFLKSGGSVCLQHMVRPTHGRNVLVFRIRGTYIHGDEFYIQSLLVPLRRWILVSYISFITLHPIFIGDSPAFTTLLRLPILIIIQSLIYIYIYLIEENAQDAWCYHEV